MSMKLNSYDIFKNEYDPSKISSIGKSTQVTSESEKTKNAQAVPQTNENISVTPETTNKASRTAKLDNVSVSFNKNDSYGHIGSSKDITKLDQTSNVDNKVKSGIFNDYLYYAGSSTTGNAQTPHFISDDGSVTLKGRLAPMENAGV